MAKKQENQEMLIYAGISIPKLLLRQGKVYKQIPAIPKEYSFLKEYFIPLKEYTQFKMQNKEKIKQLSKKIREVK